MRYWFHGAVVDAPVELRELPFSDGSSPLSLLIRVEIGAPMPRVPWTLQESTASEGGARSWRWTAPSDSPNGSWHRSRFSFGDESVEFVTTPDGSAVLIDDSAGTRKHDLEAVLTASILGGALRSAGVFCLHGNAAIVEGRAIAIVGQQRAGKSSLTAALLRSGCTLLCDDIIALATDGPAITAQRGPARLRMWPDTLAALGAGLGPAAPVYSCLRGDEEKWVVRLEPALHASAASVPLGVVLQLVPTGDGVPRLRRLHGVEAVQALAANTYAPWHVSRRAAEFRQLSHVAREVPVHELRVPRGFDRLPSVVQLIRGMP